MLLLRQKWPINFSHPVAHTSSDVRVGGMTDDKIIFLRLLPKMSKLQGKILANLSLNAFLVHKPWMVPLWLRHMASESSDLQLFLQDSTISRPNVHYLLPIPKYPKRRKPKSASAGPSNLVISVIERSDSWLNRRPLNSIAAGLTRNLWNDEKYKKTWATCRAPEQIEKETSKRIHYSVTQQLSAVVDSEAHVWVRMLDLRSDLVKLGRLLVRSSRYRPTCSQTSLPMRCNKHGLYLLTATEDAQLIMLHNELLCLLRSMWMYCFQGQLFTKFNRYIAKSLQWSSFTRSYMYAISYNCINLEWDQE